ncbi:MAG: alpha/beta fold hydrolase [Solirubrobacterales bacterium]
MSLSTIDTGSGPAVLLLHGQPGTGAHWAPVTERLRDRMRVIAPDRPGYGRTGGRAGGFGENASAAVELLDRLEVASAIVAGHSWGAGVALALASRFPQRVRALVLVGAMVPRTQPSLVDRLWADRRFGPPATRLGLQAGGLVLSRPFMRRLTRATAPELEDQLAATAREWRSDGACRSFYTEQRALVDELPALAPQIPSIQTPTTVLSGARDLVSPPSHARALAQALPNAHLVSVKRAGHMLPQKRPGLVAKAIMDAGAAAAPLTPIALPPRS